MRSLLSRKLNGVANHFSIALPALFVTASAATAIGTPPAHSLLINAVACGLVCIYSTLKVGLRSEGILAKTRRLCFAAACLLALAQICERGPGSRSGLWWAKVSRIKRSCIPILTITLRHGFRQQYTPSSRRALMAMPAQSSLQSLPPTPPKHR